MSETKDEAYQKIVDALSREQRPQWEIEMGEAILEEYADELGDEAAGRIAAQRVREERARRRVFGP